MRYKVNTIFSHTKFFCFFFQKNLILLLSVFNCTRFIAFSGSGLHIIRPSGGLLTVVDAVDNQSDGSVTGHIACGAKAVHRDVQGYHKGLLLSIKAQD